MNAAMDENWDGARIGILGGTFDPPHAGHVRMASVARDVLGLDRVFFSPAPYPPHKSGEPVTAFEHRRGMTRAAIAGEAALALTGIEQSAAPSYTSRLLQAAAARTTADLYFILGADSLAQVPAWHQPQEILRLCTLVVFPRNGAAVQLPVVGPATVVVFEEPRVDISSTRVREALEAGVPVTDEIPPGVAAYIDQHRLYRRS